VLDQTEALLMQVGSSTIWKTGMGSAICAATDTVESITTSAASI